ncbi:acetyl-CoA carboxylase biotin carboxylase subunit family protein [Micromonospora parva]|uniref:ATP-grasp domain-containing protein n=1 Tax=Micromonospora parva TaxID=1464048 RepID=UPI0004BF3DDA|nr:ATP-grasp domain-containing protein [Micromonospora parva]
MRILILHRITDDIIRYADGLDFEAHEVTFIGTAERMATLPARLPGTRIERPGTGATETEVVAALAGHPKPDLVIAQSEFDLIAAARIREALDVPGPREADVLPVRDKVMMKAAAARAGLRVPRYLPLASALAGADIGWSGQTVLKPLDGASSQGVRVFDTAASALETVRRDGLPSDADPSGFEIEEFVSGPIIHVDGLAVDGTPVTLQASRYVGTCLGYAEGSPLGSVQTDTPPAVVEWTTACLQAVGITTSLFHLEGIETPDGLVFLEVASRFGGAGVADTFELATGVHMPSVQLRALSTPGASAPEAHDSGPDSRYGWFIVPGHTLGARFCTVDGADEFRRSPLTWRWVQRTEDEPVSQALSYAEYDVPVAGIVGPAPTAVLEQFLRDIFASVKVTAAGKADNHV